MKMRYTIRQYGNYNKVQLFATGGLYTYNDVAVVLRDHVFKDFCYK